MHKSITDIINGDEISSYVKQKGIDAKATSHITGDTVYYEVGYLCSALASANKTILDLQQQIDQKEIEDSPFTDVKQQLRHIEDRLTQVWDKVI